MQTDEVFVIVPSVQRQVWTVGGERRNGGSGSSRDRQSGRRTGCERRLARAKSADRGRKRSRDGARRKGSRR
jgi:hypothetical protein